MAKRAAGKTATERGAERKADKLAAQAKERGATGPNGSDSLRAIRDAAILGRLACGCTADEVACEFGLSARSIRAIAQRARAASPLNREPLDLAEELVGLNQRLVSGLLQLAFANQKTNPSVALGSLKSASAVAARLEELLREIGILPRNLHHFRDQADLMMLGSLVLARLRDAGEGRLTVAEAQEAVIDLVSQRRLVAPGDAPPDGTPAGFVRKGAA